MKQDFEVHGFMDGAVWLEPSFGSKSVFGYRKCQDWLNEDGCLMGAPRDVTAIVGGVLRRDQSGTTTAMFQS